MRLARSFLVLAMVEVIEIWVLYMKYSVLTMAERTLIWFFHNVFSLYKGRGILCMKFSIVLRIQTWILCMKYLVLKPLKPTYFIISTCLIFAQKKIFFFQLGLDDRDIIKDEQVIVFECGSYFTLYGWVSSKWACIFPIEPQV